MLKIIQKLCKSEKGATAIEYGLIAALVSVAAIPGPWTARYWVGEERPSRRAPEAGRESRTDRQNPAHGAGPADCRAAGRPRGTRPGGCHAPG